MKRVNTVLDVVVTTLESNPPQFVIIARGKVNSGGWSEEGMLRPFGTPRDGVQDYEFLATPPPPGNLNIQVMSIVKASLKIGYGSPTVNAVRVWADTNNIELTFREEKISRAVASPNTGMRTGGALGGGEVELLTATVNLDDSTAVWPLMPRPDGGVAAFPWKINPDGGVDVLPWSVHAVPRDVPLLLRDIIGRRIRVVPFGSVVTQEIQPGRVTIYLNERGLAFDVRVDPGLDTV